MDSLTMGNWHFLRNNHWISYDWIVWLWGTGISNRLSHMIHGTGLVYLPTMDPMGYRTKIFGCVSLVFLFVRFLMLYPFCVLTRLVVFRKIASWPDQNRQGMIEQWRVPQRSILQVGWNDDITLYTTYYVSLCIAFQSTSDFSRSLSRN